MTYVRLVNGKEVPLSAEEIAEFEAHAAAHEAEKNKPPPAPNSITRRQCALQLLAMQTITAEEALAMTKTAEVPAAVAQVLTDAVNAGQMTPEQRILAEIDFAATNYYRNNFLLGKMGLTDPQIDEFFIAAAQL